MPGDGADHATSMAAASDHLDSAEAIKKVGQTADGKLVVTNRRILEIADSPANGESLRPVDSTRFTDISRVTVSNHASTSNTVRWLAGGCLLYLGFSTFIFGFLERGDVTAALFAFVVIPAGVVVVARASDPPPESIVLRLHHADPEERINQYVLSADQEAFARTVNRQAEAARSPSTTE